MNLKKMIKTFTTLFALSFSFVLAQSNAPQIGKRQDRGEVQFKLITEASGLAASRKNRDVLWAHNDSGDRNLLYAMNAQSRHLGTYEVVGVENRDWEDIAVGPGPRTGQQYIYVGEIGDNDAVYNTKYIYRILEPRVDATRPGAGVKLYGVEKIAFVFPDGNRDAETLMVDPLTKDIYVISKREKFVRVYRAAFPQFTDRVNRLEHVTTLNFTMAVGGDISPDGNEILVKTYDAIYYWRRLPGQPLWRSFAKPSEMLPYFMEPQGESVTWHGMGAGYFTVSEEYKNIPTHLYFYPKK